MDRLARAAGVAGIAVFALAACNRSSAPPSGDTIAEVGGVRISASDLDREFALAGIAADKRTEDQARTVLRDLVARKFLAAKAQDAKLDNDPVVAGDLQRTRDQILSAAFAQQEFKEKAKGIKPEEVSAYIAAHPAQFDKRVVFVIDQMAVPLGPDPQKLGSLIEGAKTLDDIEPKLDEMHVPHNRGRSELDGAVLTESFAKALSNPAPDALFFWRRDPQGVYFKVLKIDPRPITGAEAEARATKEIQAQVLASIAKDDAAAALAATKFSGDYARIMTAPPTPAASASATPAPTASPQTAAAPAPAPQPTPAQ